MKNFIFIRHGEALHNVFSKAWELGDESMLTLTERGFVQATSAAEQLLGMLELRNGGPLPKEAKVRIYSSDLHRAKQTTRIIQSVLEGAHGVLTEASYTEDLREFYTVFDGKRPTGFSFDEFMNDPFSGRYQEVNATCGYPKVRDPIRVMVELGAAMHLDSWREKEDLVIVGHHFTLNVLTLIVHWEVLAEENGWEIPNLFSAWLRIKEHPEPGVQLFFKHLVRETLKLPLANATPVKAYRKGLKLHPSRSTDLDFELTRLYRQLVK